MDSVSVAFELMRGELMVSVENLNSDGAILFQAGQYAEAKALADKGAALNAFCQRVETLFNEWENGFAEISREAGANSGGEKAAKKIMKHSKRPKTGLLVHFPDGTIVSEDTAANTLVKTVETIGLGRVQELGILVNGENLVSSEPSEKPYMQGNGGERSVRGYFVKTHSSTAQKKRDLEKISNSLGLGLKIEIHSMGDRGD